MRLEQIVEPSRPGAFFEGHRQSSTQSRQELQNGCGFGDQRCFTYLKKTCLLLVVRTSLSELSRATLVFRCSCFMGNPDRGRGRIGIPMTRSSSSVKAEEWGQ